MNLVKHGATNFLCKKHLIQQHAIVHRVANRINQRRNIADELKRGLYSFDDIVRYHRDIVERMVEKGIPHKDPLTRVEVANGIWKAYRGYTWEYANRSKQAICECPYCLINYLYNRHIHLAGLSYTGFNTEQEFPDQSKWKRKINNLIYRYDKDEGFRKLYGKSEECIRQGVDAFCDPPTNFYP